MDNHIHIEQLEDGSDHSSYSSNRSKDSIEIDRVIDTNRHNRHSSTSTLVGGSTSPHQHYPYSSKLNRPPFAVDIKTTMAKRRRRGNSPSGKDDRSSIYRFFHSETGRLVCAFIYFFVVCIGMAFCNQLSDNRWVETDYTKILLKDRGFDVIAAQADIQPANTFVMTSVVFTVLGIGLICPNWTTRAMVVRRIMWIIGTLSAYRALTLSVTTLPTPKAECNPTLKTGFWDMFMVSLQMIPGTVEACTDDIFSGHTVFMVTCAIQWRLYCKNKWITYFAYLYISIGLYFVVATRLHYTVDVVLAVFITYAIWSIYINMIEVVMEEEYFGVKSHHEKYVAFDNSIAEYEFSQEDLECAETKGDDETSTTSTLNLTFTQRRRQLEHTLNGLRGPRIGYGRGEYDRVAFVPMQFNLWLKNIIRWCDGLDLRMKPQTRSSTTSVSRWDELVVRYRARKVEESTDDFQSSSRIYRRSDWEQEDDMSYEYETRRKMVEVSQSGQGRWHPLRPNSTSSRTLSSNSREDKPEKTEHNRDRAAADSTQWPKKMESYPGGSINRSEPNIAQTLQQPKVEQGFEEVNPDSQHYHEDGARHERYREVTMKYLAAYLLLTIGGNASPSAANITDLLATVGIEAESERIESLISQLSGKDINELIAEGTSKLASVPAGGASAAAAAPAGGAAASEAKAEEKKEEPKEESDDDMGFGLFD
ncbi:60S acidic ribosomal protein P2 [Entomortierella lignicola]|nr:60S acidic ribosomal protein P2 [Entomortierella lignicola]